MGNLTTAVNHTELKSQRSNSHRTIQDSENHIGTKQYM